MVIVVYRVESILNGYVAHVAGDFGTGFAQGRSRNRAIASALNLALRNIAAALDEGTLALADAMSIRFEEAVGDTEGKGTR